MTFRFANRIVSGGQTGVDRAALDFAIEHNYPHGGWCTKGRRAEDGVIPTPYQLTETDSEGYKQRTTRNVEDSDATLILNLGPLDGGSLETHRIAVRMGKPVRVVQLDQAPEGGDERLIKLLWLRALNNSIVNVAGPRESKRPGVYRAARQFLDRLAAEASIR